MLYHWKQPNKWIMTLAASPFSSAFLGCAVPPYVAIPPVALEGLWTVINIVGLWTVINIVMVWFMFKLSKLQNTATTLTVQHPLFPPCLSKLAWCSWKASSISASSFSRASCMFFSTCCLCCFSISSSDFQRLAYSNSKVPGRAKRGGSSRSLDGSHNMQNVRLKQWQGHPANSGLKGLNWTFVPLLIVTGDH